MQVIRVYPVRGLNYKVSEEDHYQFAKGEKILLNPDNDNSFDPNAVGVHYSFLNDARIGFLPKDVNEFYFLFLSQGGTYEAEIFAINEFSDNHSLDFLFIQITFSLRKQSEFDLFLKHNEIQQSTDLSIDRWVYKRSRNNKNKIHAQRGYLIAILEIEAITLPGQSSTSGLYGKFLLAKNFKFKGPIKTIEVQVEKLPNKKYKIVAEFNENEQKHIKVNDDFEYELTDIGKLRKKFRYASF